MYSLVGVLSFAGTNFRELFFLLMSEVQFFVFGLLSFAKIAKFVPLKVVKIICYKNLFLSLI